MISDINTAIQLQKPLVFVHIGDLHINQSKKGTTVSAKGKNRNGSNANRISAWIGNGIPGTQFGCNRNAKPIK